MTQYFFTPPVAQIRPTFLPDSTELQKSLWSHFANYYQGVNCWLMSDGSVVQSYPTPENSNDNLSNVYPWNPDAPSAPYVTTVMVPALPAAQVATVTTVSHTTYPVAFFPGGSTSPITEAQYNLLLDYTEFGTGYSDCLSEH